MKWVKLSCWYGRVLATTSIGAAAKQTSDSKREEVVQLKNTTTTNR